LTDLPINSRERTRIETLARRAVADYQRALSVDNHLALAHLHIGWLHLILGDNRAGSELEAAAADAATSRTRYLAHLFLGAFAERGKRLEDARREYAEALAAGPEFQSAFMALSRAEEALGNSRRARDLAEQCAQLRKVDADPWWDFMASFDREALEELRQEARRQ
jgi:tetratricopeptide (TPR) repeat protein